MSDTPRMIWAYTYRLVPPQSADRLRKVKALLEHEHREATRRAGTWEGRLVTDERISHILVLSDSPDLDHEVNQRLERELQAIDADFAVTVPLAVSGGPGDGDTAIVDPDAPMVEPVLVAPVADVPADATPAVVAPSANRVPRRK